MSERRFTDKPELNPEAVRDLPPGHPALVENRTLFPTTVVTVTEDEPTRLLISGRNNRKLGATVEKGRFKGYALYALSLEERATCPVDCSIRDACYGNGMQLARRHRIGDPEVFFDRLGFEICGLMDEHPAGLLIRLHVLGDFPSAEYVAFWAEVLDEHPKVAIYGYTHRKPSGDVIGAAIQGAKDRFKDRFRIRWSTEDAIDDAARVISHVPPTPRTAEGIVCPAQTSATGCCATCGLCWESPAKVPSIAFIKHGPKPIGSAIARTLPKLNAVEPATTESAFRAIKPIEIPTEFMPRRPPGAIPTLELRDPRALCVEPSYQRDLSGASVRHIRRIVAGWDWAKFKPPVCARHGDALFVIDGQHTAIAAASHPMVETIPVLIVDAPKVERRADAFVSHNRDRLAMTAHQIFHAAVAAGEASAVTLRDAITSAGGNIPKFISAKGKALRSEFVAINDLGETLRTFGFPKTKRLVNISIKSGVTPIKTTVTRGLRFILSEPDFADVARLPDEAIAIALGSHRDIELASRKHANKIEKHRYRACAELIAAAARRQKVAA